MLNVLEQIQLQVPVGEGELAESAGPAGREELDVGEDAAGLGEGAGRLGEDRPFAAAAWAEPVAVPHAVHVTAAAAAAVARREPDPIGGGVLEDRGRESLSDGVAFGDRDQPPLVAAAEVGEYRHELKHADEVQVERGLLEQQPEAGASPAQPSDAGFAGEGDEPDVSLRVGGAGDGGGADFEVVAEVGGDGSNPQVDIAVDPIDGTTLTSKGRGGAVAVIAVSEQGTMFDPGPCVYMEKIAVGPDVAGKIDINASVADNLHAVAEAKGIPVREVTATILDRPRHDDLVAEVRETGSRIRLIGDGDVAAAIATAYPDSGVDILFGIGGTPEGVIAAAALKCMGGELVGKLWPRDAAERQTAVDAGYDLDRVLSTDDLVAGDNCFFSATGITDGNLLKGVHYDRNGATTQSLVMRSRSGTVRVVEARHRPDKLGLT